MNYRYPCVWHGFYVARYLICSRVFSQVGRSSDFLSLRGHQAFEVGSVDHAAVDLELSECVVDLGGGELVAEGHEGVSEGFSIDLAVDLEGLKRLDDGLVVVGAAGHLASEQGDHLGEVHGSVGLIQHALGLSAADGFAVVGESSGKVRSAEESIFVNVHDAEGLLELLDGGVGEGVEDVCFLGHLGLSKSDW